MEKQKNAIGRRKEAVTRIFLTRGTGKITVNDKDYKEYFTLIYLQNQVELPMKSIQSLDKFDVKINADGGGLKGQAEAAKLGIARAPVGQAAECGDRLRSLGLGIGANGTHERFPELCDPQNGRHRGERIHRYRSA